jgi:hypothetical protein
MGDSTLATAIDDVVGNMFQYYPARAGIHRSATPVENSPKKYFNYAPSNEDCKLIGRRSAHFGDEISIPPCQTRGTPIAELNNNVRINTEFQLLPLPEEDSTHRDRSALRAHIL